MNNIKIYTDGSCLGNPGVGGIGIHFIDIPTGGYRDVSKFYPDTTNNRMELQAVITALSMLKGPSTVEVITDSKYVIDGATSWLTDWVKKGWKRSDKKPVANVELWQELLPLLGMHSVTFTWVKGHENDVGNIRVDSLANTAARTKIDVNQCGSY